MAHPLSQAQQPGHDAAPWPSHCGAPLDWCGSRLTWEGDWEITRVEYRCRCGLSVATTVREHVGPPAGRWPRPAATRE